MPLDCRYQWQMGSAVQRIYRLKLLDFELFVPTVIVPETESIRTVLALLEQIF